MDIFLFFLFLSFLLLLYMCIIIITKNITILQLFISFSLVQFVSKIHKPFKTYRSLSISNGNFKHTQYAKFRYNLWKRLTDVVVPTRSRPKINHKVGFSSRLRMVLVKRPFDKFWCTWRVFKRFSFSRTSQLSDTVSLWYIKTRTVYSHDWCCWKWNLYSFKQKRYDDTYWMQQKE